MFTENRSRWWMQALGLCGVLTFGGVAVAQYGEPPSGSPGQGQPSSAPTTPHAGLGEAATEERILIELHQVAKLQEEQADIAEDEAASPEVRQYARLVEADAEQLADKTKALAKQKAIGLPDVDADDDPEVKKLDNASGAQVDTMFVAMIASGDKKVGEALNRLSSVDDPQMKKLANEYRPVLKQHKNMTKALESKTGESEGQPQPR